MEGLCLPGFGEADVPSGEELDGAEYEGTTEPPQTKGESKYNWTTTIED